MEEEWRDVVGWEDLYEVSNLGSVRRKPTRGELQPLVNSNGYLCVALCRNNKVKRCYIHILVARAFLGPCEDGLQVNHKDGDRTNPSIDNLEYLTCSENIRHSWRRLGRKGRNPKPFYGEGHANAKLTNKQAREIVTLYRAGGVTQMQLARQFGIHQTIISDIVRGSLWTSVTSDLFKQTA